MARPVVATALVKMLHMLYEADILSEEAILSWHGNVNSPDDIPERNKLRKQVKNNLDTGIWAGLIANLLVNIV